MHHPTPRVRPTSLVRREPLTCGPLSQGRAVGARVGSAAWEERQRGPAPRPEKGESAARWRRRCLAKSEAGTEVALADEHGLRQLHTDDEHSPPAQSQHHTNNTNHTNSRNSTTTRAPAGAGLPIARSVPRWPRRRRVRR